MARKQPAHSDQTFGRDSDSYRAMVAQIKGRQRMAEAIAVEVAERMLRRLEGAPRMAEEHEADQALNDIFPTPDYPPVHLYFAQGEWRNGRESTRAAVTADTTRRTRTSRR